MSDDAGLGTTRGLGGHGDSRVLRFAALAEGALFAGRYEIRARLGSGGSGEVLRAFDRTAAVEVALKVLYPAGDDGRVMLERLRRELHIVRALAHDGIVRVHDIGEADGLLYLVMDLLAGETLAARLKRGPLDTAEAVRVLEQVLGALAAAHAQGVTHRDIKPANIFLAGERVVVLDFGIARRRDDRALTASGAVVGTPEYVSPEQATGGETGPASDLYSLGIVLWEMLEGRPPFHADSDFGVLAAQVTKPLPRMPESIRPAPAAVRDLLAWLLEKDPARRPRDAGEALAYLRRGRRRGLGALAGHALRGVRVGAGVAAMTGLCVLAAVALGVASLVPSSGIYNNSSEIVVPSVLGNTLRTARLDGQLLESEPLGRWRHLLLLHGRTTADGRAYPFVLDSFDARTGKTSALPLAVQHPELLRSLFPRFSPRYHGHFLRRQTIADELLHRRLFMAGFTHEREYPGAIVLFDEVGDVRMTIATHGSFRAPTYIAPHEREPGLFVLPVEQHDLDLRPSVVAVAWNPRSLNLALTSPSGYDVLGIAQPSWTTYLSRGRYQRELRATGDVLVASGEGVAWSVRLDARTGAPADLPQEARAQWLVNQRDLQTLLLSRSPAQPPEGTATDFERLAARAGLDTAQRGVALGRAADEWRRAGRLDRALACANKAAEVEPEILGHMRRLVDLHARQGDLPAVLRIRSAHAADPVGLWPELRRDVVVAEILLGRADPALVPLMVPTSYSEFIVAASMIAREDYDGAAARFASNPNSECWVDPDLALLDALAELMRAAPDLQRARKLLDVVADGRGAGRHPPGELLRMLLESRAGDAHPVDGSRVRKLLADHAEAGRSDLIDWLYATWAERIAARLLAK